MKRYKIPFFCEKGHEGTILGAYFSADGKFLLHGVCILCATSVSIQWDMVDLIGQAAVKDDEEDFPSNMIRN